MSEHDEIRATDARQTIWLDPCPDSAWRQLPGGPVALNASLVEVWQYTGTAATGDSLRHEFRHRAHPDYGGQRAYAHVVDGDDSPTLGRFVVQIDNGDDPTSSPGARLDSHGGG